MTAATPTFGQIKAQVTAIHQKVPHARVIGIRSPGRWSGPAEERDGDQSYVISQCDSPLAMRVALRQPVDERTTKVLITPLEDSELSEDILLRLAKRRLFQIDAWQIVRSLFQARAIDPRLSHHSWIADALLDAVSADGYPAARGGFLDAETVWPLLLRRYRGLEDEAPDLTSILKWSLDAGATARFRQSPSHFQTAAVEWLSEKAGPVAELVLQCLGRLDRPDAVPLGLAVGVVFHPDAIGKLEKATGKLEERYLGGKSPDPKLMLRWSAAATEVVRALRHTEPRACRQTLQRADEILSEIQAEAFARLSDTSPLGFDQRLVRFGHNLAETVARQSWGLLDGLQSAHQVVRAHDHSTREARRLERVDMSMRLVRWLAEQGPAGPNSAKSLAEAAEQHLHDGGFVDWARLTLRAGDPVRELSEAYARLFDAARTIRELQSQHFAQLLVDWTTAGSQGTDIVPVERVLEQFVAPIAAESPVLVIVIDGMSVAVCRELLADLTKHEWIALSEPSRSSNRSGLATIPSVTEFSRTSLLSGRLRQGGQAEEQAGFAEHPALLARCPAGFPPVLFHKVSLQEAADAVLAAEVRKEIASTHRRIVGVVINAVDDHLLKGEQIDTRWSRDEIKVLPALLHEARIARRKVILISDHGHVLDCQAESRPSDAGERWRTATGVPAADELLVEGHRVLADGHRLIAPWTERVRYGVKKNGYHGGLTPQEMVVPVVVLSSTDDIPAGWQEQPIDIPAWWDEPTNATAAQVRPTPKLKPSAPKDARLLFDLDAEEQPAAVDTAVVTTPQWVHRLLKSPVFDEQKQLAGRGIPTDDVLAKFLSTLDRRGGKLTSIALARALAFPEMRLPGLLAKVQRILNVDGYAVLNRDDASDTIELNRDLLLKQFDLV
jgi:hypothetical protein